MDEFIELYGIHAFNDLMAVLVDEGDLPNASYKNCDDDLCDDEACVLYKSYQKYFESKK